jgi:hypothetical protein
MIDKMKLMGIRLLNKVLIKVNTLFNPKPKYTKEDLEEEINKLKRGDLKMSEIKALEDKINKLKEDIELFKDKGSVPIREYRINGFYIEWVEIEEVKNMIEDLEKELKDLKGE